MSAAAAAAASAVMSGGEAYKGYPIKAWHAGEYGDRVDLLYDTHSPLRSLLNVLIYT